MPQPVALRRDPSQSIVPLRTGPAERHLVDGTLYFAPTGGGVRRYLLAEHGWLSQHARLRHTILVPGPRSDGPPTGLMRFATPAIPICGRLTAHASNLTALGSQQANRQLARLLASRDPFVHAGDQQTFGGVVLESMACGLPVIAARADAAPDLVDENVSATFEPRAPLDLARKVRGVFERSREAAGRAARRRAENHGWDAALTRLLSRYSRLMARPPPLEQRSRNAG